MRAPVHAWAIAFALGVGLALCEADIFVPLFWQRRAAVQVGLVLVAALLQTPLLIPPVRGFLQAIQWHRSPVRALAHWAIALGLGASLLALGSTAGSRFLSAFQTSPEEVIATTAGLLNREVLWAYLGLMGVLFVLHGTRSRLARLTQQERTLLPLFFLAAAFAAVYLLNTLLPMLDVRAGKFAMPEVVPTYEPVGMDSAAGCTSRPSACFPESAYILRTQPNPPISIRHL